MVIYFIHISVYMSIPTSPNLSAPRVSTLKREEEENKLKKIEQEIEAARQNEEIGRASCRERVSSPV